MNADELIRTLAIHQHGVVARLQLRDRGVSRSAIRSRISSGALVPLSPRVVLAAGCPPSWKQDLMAAVLDAGPLAAASHEAAAALLGLPGYWQGPLDVSRQRRAERGLPVLGELHEPKYLPEHHVTEIDGIRVTTLPRTLFDLAGVAGARIERTSLAVDNATSRNPAVLAGLRRMLDELSVQGRPGITDMREILEIRPEGYVPPASGLEARAIALLDEAGIATRRQVDLGGDSWVGRVDLLAVGFPVVIEVDSAVHHTSHSDRLRDQRRDEELAALGLRVVRITDFEVFVRPWAVAPRVRAALRAGPGVPVPESGTSVPIS